MKPPAGAFKFSSLLFLYGWQGISFFIFGYFASPPMLLAASLLPLSGLMAGSGITFALSLFLLTPLTVTFLGFLCLFPGLLVAFALDQTRPTSKKSRCSRGTGIKAVQKCRRPRNILDLPHENIRPDFPFYIKLLTCQNGPVPKACGLVKKSQPSKTQSGLYALYRRPRCLPYG